MSLSLTLRKCEPRKMGDTGTGRGVERGLGAWIDNAAMEDDRVKRGLGHLPGRGDADPDYQLAESERADTPHGSGDCAEAEVWRQVFDACRPALAVVDENALVITCNPAARHAISISSHMMLSPSNHLQMTDPELQSTLLSKLGHRARTLSADQSEIREGNRRCGEPLLRVTALSGDDDRVLAILTLRLDEPARFNHILAATRFGLSRAELAICDRLIGGCSVKDIAAARGTSTETVRYQLKSIFSKTATNSQHSLVSLLLRSTPTPLFTTA